MRCEAIPSSPPLNTKTRYSGWSCCDLPKTSYEDGKVEIEANLPVNPRTGKKRDITKDDFAAAGAIMLPEEAKYDYLAPLSRKRKTRLKVS